MAASFLGDPLLPTFDSRVGLAVPFGVSIFIAAALATIHRFVIDPPEESKRKRVPKRRHIIMAPKTWTDKRTLYSTPRAFECWLKLQRTDRGGVILGSAGPSTTRAINLEVQADGKPHLTWNARNFAYSWTVDTDVRTGEWVHLVVTFASNSALDMLLCFVDGVEVEDAHPEVPLPAVVPELPMMVGRDHSLDPQQSFDGELAAVRLWSCALADEVVEAHLAGSDRIYPALTEPLKAVAASELLERRLEADSLSFHPSLLLHAFRQSWPDEAALGAAPRSLDLWLRLPEGAEGGVVCSSAPAADALTVSVVPESGRVRLTWLADVEPGQPRAAPPIPGRAAGAGQGGGGRPQFELTLSTALRRGSAWTHVAFVHDPERDALCGFLNGAPAGEALRLPGSGAGPPTLAGHVRYGQDALAEGSRWFDGELSHLRFWSSALRPAAIAAHAQGSPVLGALPVGPRDEQLAAQQREQRNAAQALRHAAASAESGALEARREAEEAAGKRRAEEQQRLSKRQAAEAQTKVASLMAGRRVVFAESQTSGAGSWELLSAESGAANSELLRTLAGLLCEQFPLTRLDVHAKAGSFGGGEPSRSKAVQLAAKELGLDPKTQGKQVLEEIARRRALSTRDELVRLGVAEERIELRWSGVSSAADVLFTPRPMLE